MVGNIKNISRHTDTHTHTHTHTHIFYTSLSIHQFIKKLVKKKLFYPQCKLLSYPLWGPLCTHAHTHTHTLTHTHTHTHKIGSAHVRTPTHTHIVSHTLTHTHTHNIPQRHI